MPNSPIKPLSKELIHPLKKTIQKIWKSWEWVWGSLKWVWESWVRQWKFVRVEIVESLWEWVDIKKKYFVRKNNIIVSIKPLSEELRHPLKKTVQKIWKSSEWVWGSWKWVWKSWVRQWKFVRIEIVKSLWEWVDTEKKYFVRKKIIL